MSTEPAAQAAATADGRRTGTAHRRPLDAGPRRHAHVPARAAAGAVRQRDATSEFAERIGDGRVRASTRSPPLPRRPGRPRRHALRRAQAHRPDAGGPETIPLEYCFSDGVLLDFTGPEPGHVISAAEIEAELDRIGYEVKERDIVLIHTGAGAYNHEERYRTDHPGMSAEATRWLIERGVRMMGIDAITFDPPVWAMFEKKQFWEAHRVMWDEEYWHLENLMNLEQIGRPFGFQLCVLPVKWVGTTAAPVRAVAIVED